MNNKIESIEDTGKTYKDKNVDKKVYRIKRVTEYFEEVSVDNLIAEKEVLQARITEIDNALAQMNG